MTEASPLSGDRLALDSVEGFDAGGGWAIIGPDSGSPEVIAFEGIDDVTRELTGVERHDPRPHDSGAFVEHVLGTRSTSRMTRSSPANGGNLTVESLDGMEEDGGIIVLEPGTSKEEEITYSGVDHDGSALVGLTREDPVGHDLGTFVEAEPEGIEMMLAADEEETHDEDEPDLPPDLVAEPMLAPAAIWSTFFNGTDSKKGVKQNGKCVKINGSDGVGDALNDNCSPHSKWDFGDDGWNHGFPGDATQRNRIFEPAVVQEERGGGDAGFHKDFNTNKGNEYVLSAQVRLNNVTRAHELAFRARITIHMYDVDKRIIKKLNSKGKRVPIECNAILTTVGTTYTDIATKTCTMHENARHLKISGRATAKTYAWFRDHDEPAIRDAVQKPAGKGWQRVAGWGGVIYDRISLKRVK